MITLGWAVMLDWAHGKALSDMPWHARIISKIRFYRSNRVRLMSLTTPPCWLSSLPPSRLAGGCPPEEFARTVGNPDTDASMRRTFSTLPGVGIRPGMAAAGRP
jgi:hypothetical protein